MCPHITLLGLTLPMFGLMMLCGMIAAFVLLYFTQKQIDVTEDDALSAVLWAIICGMLGSKILYWLVEFDQVLADPHFLVETLTSGFVFYGALIGGVLGVLVFCLKKKQPLLKYVDLFAPSLVLAQAFGRIGCFSAGCCYGAESDSCLAVTYPAGIGSAAPAGVPLLPTQLFESAFLLLLTVVLVLIFRKQKRLGTTTGWYFILYGVWRFIIEFFRSDDRGFIGSLSTSQFLGIFIVLAGVALLLFVSRGKTPAHPRRQAADVSHETSAESPANTGDATDADAGEASAPVTDAPAGETQSAADPAGENAGEAGKPATPADSASLPTDGASAPAAEPAPAAPADDAEEK